MKFPRRKTYRVTYKRSNIIRGYKVVSFTGKFFSANGAARAALRGKGCPRYADSHGWNKTTFSYDITVVCENGEEFRFA